MKAGMWIKLLVTLLLLILMTFGSVFSVMAENSAVSGTASSTASGDYDCASGKHDFVAIKTVQPTETEDGYILYQCQICGVEYKEILYATGHHWSAWYIVKEPTCTAPGLEQRDCDVGAGHSETQEIPALGHDYQLVSDMTPSCTDLGMKTYKCTRCGDIYTETYGQLLDHNYVGAVTKKPTCTEPGMITYTCSVCGDSYTEPIPMLQHEYGAWIVETPAKPGVTRLEYKECALCGERIYETIPALPEIKPFFGTTEAVVTGANVAVLLLFGVLLFGEFALLLWKRRKKKQILEQKRFEESGEDGYEYI